MNPFAKPTSFVAPKMEVSAPKDGTLIVTMTPSPFLEEYFNLTSVAVNLKVNRNFAVLLVNEESFSGAKAKEDGEFEDVLTKQYTTEEVMQPWFPIPFYSQTISWIKSYFQPKRILFALPDTPIFAALKESIAFYFKIEETASISLKSFDPKEIYTALRVNRFKYTPREKLNKIIDANLIKKADEVVFRFFKNYSTVSVNIGLLDVLAIQYFQGKNSKNSALVTDRDGNTQLAVGYKGDTLDIENFHILANSMDIDFGLHKPYTWKPVGSIFEYAEKKWAVENRVSEIVDIKYLNNNINEIYSLAFNYFGLFSANGTIKKIQELIAFDSNGALINKPIFNLSLDMLEWLKTFISSTSFYKLKMINELPKLLLSNWKESVSPVGRCFHCGNGVFIKEKSAFCNHCGAQYRDGIAKKFNFSRHTVGGILKRGYFVDEKEKKIHYFVRDKRNKLLFWVNSRDS